MVIREDNAIAKKNTDSEKEITKNKKNVVPAAEKIPIKINNKNIFTGINRKLEQRMSRGHVIIDDTLDLHGFTQDEAYTKLKAFLFKAKSKNNKIVLVITGKGLTKNQQNQDQERGILNKNLPIWLEKYEFNDTVNGFRYSNQKHGGTGAYYILLKN